MLCEDDPVFWKGVLNVLCDLLNAKANKMNLKVFEMDSF